MTVVAISDLTKGVRVGLAGVFVAFGGVEAAIPKETGTLYIKPNASLTTPHSYTHPAVLDGLLSFLRDSGYRRLAVMEGGSGVNFSRLAFHLTGYDAICRRYGAKAVFLDEGPTVEVELRDGGRVRVSKLLHDQIIQRGENFYLSLPRLKTHSMTTASLGVKNQLAFPLAADRMEAHTQETLHKRLAALYALTQPDFCLIEGVTATAHGHCPPQALQQEWLVPMNLLVGGPDTLAVDVIGARILGYALEEVEHLRLCAEWGLWSRLPAETGDPEASGTQEERSAKTIAWQKSQVGPCGIVVKGMPLDRFRGRLPSGLMRRFHPDVRRVTGRKKACVEGCRGSSECIQEILYNDMNGKGGWTLVCGSGFEDPDLEGLPGDLLVVGPCACSEVGEKLQKLYPGRHVYQIPEHNDLMANTLIQARLMGIRQPDLVPLKPLEKARLLLAARRYGLNARVPPLFG
jgi:uncharacterized protein (DUF362 family)